MTLAIPTVHSNGTSRQGLLDPLVDALCAIEKAEIAVRNAAPHGRDYYSQGPDSYGIARDQHEKRLRDLRAIHRELETIAEAIAVGHPHR